MQSNVEKILEAAEAVNRFEYIAGEIFDENECYPAFIIDERRSEIKKKDERAGLYLIEWQYQGFVLVEQDDSWETLEELTGQLIVQLVSRHFFIVDWRMSEMYVSEREMLVSEIIIGALYNHKFN